MSIGFVAPLIIVVARLIQGFSAGGEIGGSASLLIEYAPPARQGLYASWLQATMGMSNLIGASLATAITFFLTKQQVMDWGWRIPFLLGVIIVPVGFWIRHGVHESPEFQKLTAGKTEGSPKKTPLLTIFSNWPFILKGIGISVLWAAGPYVLIIYMPIYVHSLLGYGSSEAFLASFIGNWFLVGACFIAGWLYDTLGRTRTLVTSIIAIAILVYPLLAIVDASHSLATLIVVQSIFCFLVGLYVGPIPATLSRIFPVSIRVSGIAISYNLAIILFGGFAPAIIIWSSSVFTSVYTPGIYMIIACVIALFSISTIQKQREGN
jgi:MHS family proline/betaine transporter-like MFS transporter